MCLQAAASSPVNPLGTIASDDFARLFGSVAKPKLLEVDILKSLQESGLDAYFDRKTWPQLGAVRSMATELKNSGNVKYINTDLCRCEAAKHGSMHARMLMCVVCTGFCHQWHRVLLQ